MIWGMYVCMCAAAHLTLHLGLLFEAAVLRSVCHGGEVCLGVVSVEHNHNTVNTVTQSSDTHMHTNKNTHLNAHPHSPPSLHDALPHTGL